MLKHLILVSCRSFGQLYGLLGLFTALGVGASRSNYDTAVGWQIIALSLISLKAFRLSERLDIFYFFLLFLGYKDRVVSKQVLLYHLNVFQIALRKSANRINLKEVKQTDAKRPSYVFENLDRIRRCILFLSSIWVLNEVIWVYSRLFVCYWSLWFDYTCLRVELRR